MLKYVICVQEKEGATSVIGNIDSSKATEQEKYVGRLFAYAIISMSQCIMEEAGNGELVTAPDEETVRRMQAAMFERFSNRNN